MELKVVEVELNDIVRNGVNNCLNIALDMDSTEDKTGVITELNGFTSLLLTEPQETIISLNGILRGGMTPMCLPKEFPMLEQLDEDKSPFCLHVVDNGKHIGIIEGYVVQW